jgi:hypothetical protein
MLAYTKRDGISSGQSAQHYYSDRYLQALVLTMKPMLSWHIVSWTLGIR